MVYAAIQKHSLSFFNFNFNSTKKKTTKKNKKFLLNAECSWKLWIHCVRNLFFESFVSNIRFWCVLWLMNSTIAFFFLFFFYIEITIAALCLKAHHKIKILYRELRNWMQRETKKFQLTTKRNKDRTGLKNEIQAHRSSLLRPNKFCEFFRGVLYFLFVCWNQTGFSWFVYICTYDDCFANSHVCSCSFSSSSCVRFAFCAMCI